jgi:hypothetical protein
VPLTCRPETSVDEYVDIRLSGIVTREELDGAADAFVPSLHEWSRILVDAADLDNPAEVLKMFVQSSWRPRMPQHLRQAAVVGPQAAAIARSWMRVAGPGSSGVQAFRAREPALAWLLTEYQTTTGGS